MTAARWSLPMLLLVAVTASVPVGAQERLFWFTDGSLAELGTAPGELGVLKALMRSTEPVGRVTPLAGGRLLATMKFVSATSDIELYLIDLRTSAVTATGIHFGCGEFSHSCVALILASDPRVPRLYVRDGERIAVVALGSPAISYLDYATSARFGWAQVAYTPAGPLLLVDTQPDIDVIDLTTGTLVRTVERSSSGGAFTVNRAGTRLYVTNLSASSGETTSIDVIDLATWAVVASRPIPIVWGNVFLLDERRQRLIVQALPPTSQPPGVFVILDPETLDVTATIPESALTGLGPAANNAPNQPQLALNAREDAYYLIARREVDLAPGGLSKCVHHSLSRLGANTGAVLERTDLRPIALQFPPRPCAIGSWLQVKAPPSPTLSAEVQGNAVTLSWDDPGNTTHFDLEAGSAPGLRNLLVTSLNGTSFTASGVPPGTYYLRVRAINEVGRSVPSQELKLVLP